MLAPGGDFAFPKPLQRSRLLKMNPRTCSATVSGPTLAAQRSKNGISVAHSMKATAQRSKIG
jgi:hypothetical protein